MIKRRNPARKVEPSRLRRDPAEADPVRMAAFGILLRMEMQRRSIEAPLRAAASSFEDRDRRFLWSLVQETVRWRGRLDAILEPLLHRPLARLDPPVRVLLRMSACQACVLDSIPGYANVDQAVQLARRFGPPGAERLVNAVSRRLARDGRARWDQIGGLVKESAWWIVHSHPRWLVDRWRVRWGDERTLAILKWNNQPPPIWLRSAEGGSAPEGGEPGWVPGTFRMPADYHPSADPEFSAGRFTAQDPGEALVGLLPPDTGSGKILDLCAAPGTKTTHLAGRFGAERVIALDKSRSRFHLLRDTLARTRHACPCLLGDVARPPFRHSCAAGVLLDAPCSALGVLRRRVDARWNIRESDLKRHGQHQLRLLISASRLLRPGGWLLYNVCSVEPEETSDVRSAFLESAPGFRTLEPGIELPQSIRPERGAIRILPAQEDCDGVYACLFLREGN